jgi:hypothetical protein
MAIPVIVHYPRGAETAAEHVDADEPPEAGYVLHGEWVVYDVTTEPARPEGADVTHHLWVNHRTDLTDG